MRRRVRVAFRGCAARPFGPAWSNDTRAFPLLLLAVLGPKCAVLGYTHTQCQNMGYNRACDFNSPSSSCACQSGYATITSPGSSCCFPTSSSCTTLNGDCNYGDCRLNSNLQHMESMDTCMRLLWNGHADSPAYHRRARTLLQLSSNRFD